jgi:hypothetical protein
MCDFEETDIISRYTRQQAVDDGILVEVLRWKGIPVMATSHIRDEFGLGELLGIWHKFCAWKEEVEPNLSEEEKLFSIKTNGKNVWVVEDGEAFTIMYPEDY